MLKTVLDTSSLGEGCEEPVTTGGKSQEFFLPYYIGGFGGQIRSAFFSVIGIFLVNFVTMARTREVAFPVSSRIPMSDGQKPPLSPWAYASEGTQLAVTLLVGFYIGYRLDNWKGTLPWFTLAGSVLGLIVGLYNFLGRFLKK